jgi:hypothetical protein
MAGTETIRIDHCPECSGAHDFSLMVYRTTSLHMEPGDSITSGPQRREVRVTRQFTCPVTGGAFQATVVLEDMPPLNRIETVNGIPV